MNRRPLRPFAEMTPADYASIGFRGGLEVHQQLATQRKLFCRCPAGRYSNRYDAEVLRHMRPTLSELGEYDGTALMERKTRKNIYYRIHQDTVCTYEIDDTPPFFPDERAIDIALEISLLLNLNVIGEMHVARKQYLDGSIPAGFQRTAILGVDGWIPFNERRIHIRQLSLEEDSCREVSDVGHDRVLLTDRLGMPLVETVTEPEMETPEEVADVCRLIAMISRSTGKVRTGYGAARQDVNVSVCGGTRIELKGVPQIKRIPFLVYNEALRQCSLLQIQQTLRDRGITAKSFRWSSHDVTRTAAKFQFEPIRNALRKGQRVACTVLNGFAGILNAATQEDTTFAKEFSDRVRVIACLTQLPNIVHSDTASDLLAVRDWKRLRKKTGASEHDALILVWGSQKDTETACVEIAIRAEQATQGVPSDTRQALKDGTNGFERVLPGPERMYPDTDLPPLAISAERLRSIENRLPPRVWDRRATLLKMNVPSDVVDELCVSPRAELFGRLVDQLQIDPVLAAVILIRCARFWRRSGLTPQTLSDEAYRQVFAAFKNGKITRDAIQLVLKRILNDASAGSSEGEKVSTAIQFFAVESLQIGNLDPMIAEEMRKTQSHSFSSNAQRHRFIMGRLMHRCNARISATELAKRLRDALNTGASVECKPGVTTP